MAGIGEEKGPVLYGSALQSRIDAWKQVDGRMKVIDELLAKGDLKSISPSLDRAKKSIKVAEGYLEKAKKNLVIELYDIALMTAYSCIFHAARAILFREGFAERSHVAIYLYLKEKHPYLGREFIEGFNTYRSMRHTAAYGLDTIISEKDAKEAINFAAKFLNRIKEIVR